MTLISLQDVDFGFSSPPLLQGINLHIEKGERIFLVGRNGVGKTTLMQVIHGIHGPDGGEILRSQGLKTAFLDQEVPKTGEGTILQMVADRGEGSRQNVDKTLSRMGLDPEADYAALSAGMKRRVLLARALARSPDLLLLDEPTNHLDLEGITWIEEFFLRYKGTLVVVTHDRMFLQNLATRILDLERGKLTSWNCDYKTYLVRKQAALEAEAKAWADFDKKLSQEEQWIRQGIKARRTRNEGRVRALEEMREEKRARRMRTGKVNLRVREGERTGRKVITAEKVCFSYGGCAAGGAGAAGDAGALVFRDLDVEIMRGDRVGIIGPNGVGKTTLLQVLLGRLAPDQGTVRHGTHLEVAYFDQLRGELDEEKTVEENAGDGNRTVMVGGKARHILGYLQDFLFTPDRAQSPVSFLSGGERNRLLLARLFAKPSNVLVLDEPTNDLDTETLELLEELLLNYPGTVLLVSHDRAFLNHVVTSTLVFEGKGRVGEYVGGYDDWLAQRSPEPAEKKKAAPASPRREKRKPVRKLTYKEKMELEALTGRIEALEVEQAELHETMADPAFYQQDGEAIAVVTNRLQSVKQELDQSYLRWEELESLAESS